MRIQVNRCAGPCLLAVELIALDRLAVGEVGRRTRRALLPAGKLVTRLLPVEVAVRCHCGQRHRCRIGFGVGRRNTEVGCIFRNCCHRTVLILRDIRRAATITDIVGTRRPDCRQGDVAVEAGDGNVRRCIGRGRIRCIHSRPAGRIRVFARHFPAGKREAVSRNLISLRKRERRRVDVDFVYVVFVEACVRSCVCVSVKVLSLHVADV